MKKTLFIALCFTVGQFTFGQQNLLMGVEISPSLGMSIQKDRITGILSSKNAGGFTAGIPFRWAMTESRILNTGISYEYTKFSQSITDSAGSTTKFSSLNIPLTLGIQMSGGTYFMIGGGAKYILSAKTFQENDFASIKPQSNAFQPYVSAGLTHDFFIKKGFLEIGVQARFHVLDIWKENSSFALDNSNNLLNIDLTLKWYLAGVRYRHFYHYFKVK